MEIFLKTFLKITCQNQETCLLLVLNTLHGSPWLSMALHGSPWLSMALHGSPCACEWLKYIREYDI